jgi:hypothetical protein
VIQQQTLVILKPKASDLTTDISRPKASDLTTNTISTPKASDNKH